MSWLNLNQSFSSLKGQITNFASEVLSENTDAEVDAEDSRTNSSFKELEEKCHNQQLEIASLKKLNEELQSKLQSEKLSRKNGVREEESSWYWDPPAQTADAIDPDVEKQYKIHIRALQDELSAVKGQGGNHETNNEVQRLKEENANLITNLEDLDSQHRMAMEKLLTLKTDLQKNFEVLKQEHEDLKIANDEYSNEVQNLLTKVNERDKEIARLKPFCSDYDTLAHKYQNLERIHSLLRENAEKFQEENQDLHEEIFKLQEQVTKLEHDLELAIKQLETSNSIPKEKYDELLKEFQSLKEIKTPNHSNLDEINIDDNAKVVIETLKREISDLKHKISELENGNHDKPNPSAIKAERIIQLYNKYVNFDLPVDYVGEIPSSTDNIILYKLEGVFKTVNSFKKEIDALEHKLSEKNLNITHLQTQIEDITTENDFLTTDIQHYERELDEMKKNNDFLISEIAALKNTSKLEPIIETHEDNYTKLETELADCNKMNKNFESQIRRIEKELAEVRLEKSNLQESLTDLKHKYTTMLNELEVCKMQTKNIIELESSSNIENSEKLKQAIDENDELKKKLNAVNAKNEQLAIDNHIVENDKVLLTKEIDDLKNIIKTKLDEFKELEIENGQLKASINKLQKKLDETTLQTNLTQIEKRVAENSEGKTDDTKNNESNLLSEQLKQSLSENSTLKIKIDELNNAIVNLKHSFTELSTENQTLKNEEAALVQKIDTLEKIIADNKDKVAQLDSINKDVVILKEENKKLLQTKEKLEADLFSTNNKVISLEEELGKLVSDLNDKDTTIEKIRENNLTLEKMNQKLALKNQELEVLNEKYEKVTEEFNRTNDILNRSQEELGSLHVKKEEIDKQLYVLSDELNNKNAAIATLTDRLEKLEKTNNEYKSLADNKDKEIKELNQSIVELTDKMKTNNTHQNDEYAKLVDEVSAIGKISFDLNSQLELKQKEISDLEHKIEQFEKAYVEYQNIVEQSQIEKASLINLVNLKHNESLQYHNEIQRLNHVILEQTEEYKKMIEEKDALLQNTTNNCLNCDTIKIALKEKDEIIAELNRNIADYDKLKVDYHNASETIKNLTKKCEDLDKNFRIQLETVKQLTAENVQLAEQEHNSSRELERLRQHLMEMEENYTQDLMTSEQKLTECQTRLHQVEEKAKQTSTVYTSNCIRANQEVETLRNQIKLLEKQREEVQARLSEAEDFKSRSEASLTNLQIVLEQFQLEKERDIAAATEKIRNKLEDIKNQNLKLKDEITRLNSKLEESLAGLQAASRLGDQVETKSAQINDLKEQVRTLQTSVAAAEERYYNAISNQQDKVDKNLIKNLLINYVVTGAQSVMNKTQVLRILSTVLDFNQQECEKLGLVRSATTTDSLAAEFVKFLQNESKPRPQMQNVIGLGPSRSTTPTSRRSSTMGPNPILEPGHRRNPSTGSNNVLFQNLDSDAASQKSTESEPRVVALGHMETGVNQTRNNESAILKYVLKDI
ncbi:thyroid receptor-interacting protein 11-like [Battus philenor]|uniref:thyroid receptor-interacting protein 11-like n=1 Tax=Battus philenor TaxID=42288 RepID=UPI0035D05A18